MPQPFHLAIPVDDLDAARAFYGDLLGCPEGRSADHWIDWDLFGHQVVTHLDARAKANQDPEISRPPKQGLENPVDGKQVPVPHFGVVLKMEDWRALADRLTGAGIDFVIEPYIRFEGEIGEQATMFFKDPSGNALEFKGFQDMDQLFAKV